MRIVGRVSGGKLIAEGIGGTSSNPESYAYVVSGYDSYNRDELTTTYGTSFRQYYKVDKDKVADVLASAVSRSLRSISNNKLFFVGSAAPSFWGTYGKTFFSDAADISWSEFEDGTLISDPIKLSRERRYIYLVSRSFAPEPVNEKLTIGGTPYTVGVIDLGIKLKSDSSFTPSDDYRDYFQGSKDSFSYNGLAIVQVSQEKRVVTAVNANNFDFAPIMTDLNGNYAKISTVSKNGSYYDVGDDSPAGKGVCTYLKATPATYKPWARIPTTFGQRSKGFTLAPNVTFKSGATCPLKIVSGSTVLLNESAHVKSNPIVLTTDQLLKAGYGKRTLTVTVGPNVYTPTVEIIPNAMSIQGRPMSRDDKPKRCSIVKSVVLSAGATESWEVTNNGNDVSPTWEPYEGDSHVFTNATKTAEKWAVNWRCVIGGESATARSKIIKQVGLAVI